LKGQSLFLTQATERAPPLGKVTVPIRSPGRSSGPSLRERPGGPTQDELLDEALKETFPASDPTSVYRLGRAQ
jgi:hypothetical protein